ncbi:hypothetical protein V8E53_015682 [Lactarius tabidus]
MEKCPTEVHAYIFELACTEGGAAGIALSVGFRYVRAISAPFQWYTLAIEGTSQTRRAHPLALARTGSRSYPYVAGSTAEGEDGVAYGAEEDEPTLLTLHRLHPPSPILLDFFLQRLRPLSPGLTYVCLSGLLAFDYDMVRAASYPGAYRISGGAPSPSQCP